MGFIQKIKNKFKKREYAVFITDDGKQHEIIRINTDLSKDKFEHEKGLYLKNIDKFNNLHLKTTKLFMNIDNYYYFYNKKYSEPIPLSTNNLTKGKDKKPYSSYILNEILLTKKYYDLNQSPSNTLDFLKDPKNLIYILIGVAVIVYFAQGGSIA